MEAAPRIKDGASSRCKPAVKFVDLHNIRKPALKLPEDPMVSSLARLQVSPEEVESWWRQQQQQQQQQQQTTVKKTRSSTRATKQTVPNAKIISADQDAADSCKEERNGPTPRAVPRHSSRIENPANRLEMSAEVTSSASLMATTTNKSSSGGSRLREERNKIHLPISKRVGSSPVDASLSKRLPMPATRIQNHSEVSHANIGQVENLYGNVGSKRKRTRPNKEEIGSSIGRHAEKRRK